MKSVCFSSVLIFLQDNKSHFVWINSCMCVKTFFCLLGLIRLNLLDISGNLFSAVPSHLPPSVQQLYLSYNNFSGLDEGSFEGFLNLKFLRLSHCGLQSSSVHPQAFNHSSLVEVDLSYNKLTTTPTVPITLQYLYLEANNIRGNTCVMNTEL